MGNGETSSGRYGSPDHVQQMTEVLLKALVPTGGFALLTGRFAVRTPALTKMTFNEASHSAFLLQPPAGVPLKLQGFHELELVNGNLIAKGLLTLCGQMTVGLHNALVPTGGFALRIPTALMCSVDLYLITDDTFTNIIGMIADPF